MEWETHSRSQTYSMYSFSSLPSKHDVDSTYYAVTPETAPILRADVDEQPKIPLRRYFNPLRHLIHIFALGASAAVLQLSFRGLYWSDETEWNRRWYLFGLGQQDTLNGLQFVAKIHEILVVASLSSMVIHIARRKLVGENGIPFGLLMGAYQVGSTDYLFSGGFGHPFLKSLRPFKWKTFIVALSLALAIVYANMVGPASAIGLIPNLDWWSIADPFNGTAMQCYIGLNSTTNYPMRISTSGYVEQSFEACNFTDPGITCPGGGYESLDQWAFAWSSEGITYDIPMSNLLVKAERVLAFRFARATPSSAGVAMATTIKSNAAMIADLFWQYISSNNIGRASTVERPQLTSTDESQLFAPLVQVQCATFDYDAARARKTEVVFETDLLSNFSLAVNAYKAGYKWHVPPELWDYNQTSRALKFSWIDASHLDVSDQATTHATIASLSTVPTIWSRTWPNGTQTFEQRSTLVPCMVDARWAAAQINYDPKNNLIVKHNLSDLSVFVNDNDRGRRGLSNTISIEPEWATLLNPAKPGFSSSTYNITELKNLTAMESLLYNFVVGSTDADNNVFLTFSTPQDTTNGEYYANVSSIVASIVSMVVADGIARESRGSTLMELKPEHNGTVTLVNLQFLAGGEKMEPYERSVADLERDNYVPVSFHVQRWGYGYGLKNQTVLFAVSVLLFHGLLCICYFIATFYFWSSKDGWTSHAWKDVGELVALALVSEKPDVFENTGAGIKHTKTWNAKMTIRERGDSGIELVANRKGGRLEPNENLLKIRKKYGS